MRLAYKLTWIVALLMIVLPWAAFAAEQRCNDLVDGCECSEPLNAGDNLPAMPSRHWNPSDSTTKGCDDNGADPEAVLMPEDYSLSSNPRANDAGVPFANGANPFVYKTKMEGQQNIYGNSLFNVDEETVCFRAYRRYSSGAQIPSGGWAGGERLKNVQLAGSGPLGGFRADAQHNPDGLGTLDVSFVNADYDALDSGNGVSQFHQKCQAGWCRLESCLDQIGTHMYYRFRIKFLSTGEEVTLTNDAGEGPGSTPVELAHVSLYTSGPCCTGSQFVSHVLLARVPANPGFWIGPASELEGGTPPTITPPVLLP